VRRPRLPFARRSKRSAEGSPPSSSTAEKATAEKPSATPASPTPQASAAPQAPADPQERIDGLRAWVAQVDRKLGVRTYVGAAIAVMALAAAAVGLALTLSLKQDAATDNDIQSLRDQISAVEQSASQAAQEDVQALDRRLTELEGEVNRISAGQTTTRRELKVVQDDIKELRSQISQARSSSGGGSQGSQGSGP
jgi:cell division protein FtsL